MEISALNAKDALETAGCPETGWQQLSLCRVELGKLLAIHRYSVDIFIFWSFRNMDFWLRAEYRLGQCWVVKFVAFSVGSHGRTRFGRVCCFLICTCIDVPRPLINDLLAFLFQKMIQNA